MRRINIHEVEEALGSVPFKRERYNKWVQVGNFRLYLAVGYIYRTDKRGSSPVSEGGLEAFVELVTRQSTGPHHEEAPQTSIDLAPPGLNLLAKTDEFSADELYPFDPEETKATLRALAELGIMPTRYKGTHLKIGDHLNYYPTSSKVVIDGGSSQRVPLEDLITELRARIADGSFRVLDGKLIQVRRR